MRRLFLTNIPYDCEEGDLRGWLEAQGFAVESVRVVRDLVAGVSPAFGYVSLRGSTDDVDPIKLLWFFNQHNFSPQLFEPAAVGVKIALQG